MWLTRNQDIDVSGLLYYVFCSTEVVGAIPAVSSLKVTEGRDVILLFICTALGNSSERSNDGNQ